MTLLVVIVSSLSALFIVVVCVFICCIALPRRRRQRLRSSVVSGEFEDVSRLTSVPRPLSYRPLWLPRPTARRWFPEYGPSSRAYMPPTWQRTPYTQDVYTPDVYTQDVYTSDAAGHEMPAYTDDLSRIVRVHTMTSLSHSRPHRSTTYVDAACCYRPSSVVGLSRA